MHPTIFRVLIFPLLVAALAGSSPARAETGDVVVTLSGEAYDGPPQFIVRFNGKEIGSGTVDSSIDTAKSGRLRDVVRLEPYLQTFDYQVPDFDPQGKLEIEFPNDAFGGEGLDRNLVIYSIVVNGRAVATKDIVVEAAGAPQPTEMILGRVVLSTDGLVATVAPPAAGWPMPVPEAVPAVASGSKPATADENTAAAAAPDSKSVTAPAPTDETAAEAEVAAQPAAEPPSCEAATVSITGFGRGLVNIPTAQTKELDALAAGIPAGACRIVVTGYSSRGGSPDINNNLAQARAAAVLDYLTRQGVSFSAQEAVSKGETDQFGPAAADNQRVIVTIGP
jgi:outer membrane protein OmpA-like peptidoglycan-associated protein